MGHYSEKSKFVWNLIFFYENRWGMDCTKANQKIKGGYRWRIEIDLPGMGGVNRTKLRNTIATWKIVLFKNFNFHPAAVSAVSPNSSFAGSYRLEVTDLVPRAFGFYPNNSAKDSGISPTGVSRRRTFWDASFDTKIVGCHRSWLCSVFGFRLKFTKTTCWNHFYRLFVL